MAARSLMKCLGCRQTIFLFNRQFQQKFQNHTITNRFLCSGERSISENRQGDFEDDNAEIAGDRKRPTKSAWRPSPDGITSSQSQSLPPLTADNQYELLNSQVIPLYETPYEKQLTIKQGRIEAILSTLGRRLRAEDPDSRRPRHFKLERIRSSPTAHLPYRNKDEFSVNRGLDGDPKTVGFYVGSHADPGGVVCVPPDHLPISRDAHKQVARLFQQYIRTSPLPTCLQFNEGGHWRILRVRSNEAGDLMAVVIIHPQELSEEAILEEQNKIKEFFTNGPGHVCNLKSLYFQTCRHTRCTHEQSPYVHLLGESHIVESLGSLRFRISPDSFFQTNTAGAAVLYDVVRECCHVEKSVALMDVCCGTGAISLYMSKHVHQTLGMDVTRQAILDAKFNAQLNGIKNATFYTGKAEDLVSDSLRFFGRRDVVAVVNPSRGGLNYTVVNALRKFNLVYQVIYVSCNPEGLAMNDFARLCHPQNSKNPGKPFQLRRAIPVDMFPHTDHCELVLVFDRG